MNALDVEAEYLRALRAAKAARAEHFSVVICSASALELLNATQALEDTEAALTVARRRLAEARVGK